MKKAKLLLLGGIFALVGIFNFSSAEVFNIDSAGKITPNYICGISNISDLVLKNSTAYCKTSLPRDYSLILALYNPSINGVSDSIQCSIESLQNGSCNLSTNGGFPCIRLTSKCSVSSSSLVFGGSFELSSPDFDMYKDGLTPAVEGVKTTVNQIIPLVVFIGIGVLVVTLGFIAVRWLVNWIVKKINSVFSSRK